MTEAPSDTSDEQRFDEMFIHLTPRGATVPYNVCYDPQDNIWVATKGGLFKFHGKTRKTMWERKNVFPKKMAPFPQVICHKNQIIYTCGEHSDKTTEFRIFTLDGELKHESFIDGLLVSMTISDEGEMYITKQPTSSKSTIYRTSLDAPIGWDEVITNESGEGFYAVCSIDEDTLVAAMAQMPLHPFSKQRLVYIDIPSGKIKKSVSSAGRNDGEIFFPRNILRHGDGIVLMDKSGRFLEFDAAGNFVKTRAQIDAFLGNGFCIKDERALIALSGVVMDQDRRTICDDWLEFIDLDGSTWKAQREAKKAEKSSK
ncbi:unnamed protein product [Caenorhabditis bovis]|uniref:Uncharacterized protein n=1 Tax=Caenorhabditis bovis TaxID=2654633 RepID=A0A8S1EZK0_9PELO|nr:unnamed protein product [Caenorhabditis bovis]